MKQVAGLLAIVFTGIAVLVYGAVTIPNTFTSGTTAKSSEVNANFQALANAMPAAKTAYLPQATITKDRSTGTGGQQLLPLSVTLPAPGNVILSASGSICITNSMNEENVTLKISKTSGDVDSSSFNTYIIIQGNDFSDSLGSLPHTSTGCSPFSVSGMLSEPSAGPITYYLNGITDSQRAGANGAIQEVRAVTFTALYLPNSL